MGLWHTDGSSNLVQNTRPYSNQQKKENLQNCRLCCPSWSQNKTERMDKYLNLAKERRISTSTLLRNWKKLWKMKVKIITIVIGAFGTVTKGLLLGSWWTSGDHLNYSIIENSQNTEKSPGDLLSFKLQWKTICKCWCEKL